jgi:prepilin-type N-terminal cleavage/methylation domain-containing protein
MQKPTCRIRNGRPENYAISNLKVRKIFILHPSSFVSPQPPLNKGWIREGGFTLLEVLVATAIMGIAVAVVLQLFSANLRALSVSGDIVSAATRAEIKMREILDDDNLSETSSSETTDDGYRFDVAVTETQQERTENLQVKLLEIVLTVHWTHGAKEKTLTLRTMKTVSKAEKMFEGTT